VLVSAAAWAGVSIAVLERRELAIERSAATPSHHLNLALAYFDGVWTAEAIHAAVRRSAQILAQCGVAIVKAELVLLDAPTRYQEFHTPVSRELARALPLPKPTIYFVAGTRQRPAFDAEAIGRGNSGARPELSDTVWVTRGARDLDIVLAHELAHVLMDSGEHSEKSGNLMREETAPQNTRLTHAQCARLRETATANGLLQPVR
jgi:Zn-dependent protease with chaperone function